jgi:hypothetical protein
LSDTPASLSRSEIRREEAVCFPTNITACFSFRICHNHLLTFELI